jgi:hypothetical protein
VLDIHIGLANSSWIATGCHCFLINISTYTTELAHVTDSTYSWLRSRDSRHRSVTTHRCGIVTAVASKVTAILCLLDPRKLIFTRKQKPLN